MQVREVLNRTVPLPVILTLVIVLPVVAFLVIVLSGREGNTTSSIKATVVPDRVVDGLSPGTTRTTTLVVRNPHDYGVRVASISAGSSEAIEDCPAGLVTSEPVTNPIGYIEPNGLFGYRLTVSMAADIDERCRNRTFTLPLDVEFSSAAADR